MKICLVGPGYMPIPPKGWGAVESIIWDYYEILTEKYGIDVHYTNTSNQNEIINQCNVGDYDLVHIMYDDYITIVPYLTCKKIWYTSHYAYITSPHFAYSNGYFNNIMRYVIEYQSNIKLCALSEQILKVYRKCGYNGDAIVLHNGARDDKFRYTTEPKKSDRSVYIGKIEDRKNQYRYQHLPNIDFVGNFASSTFNVTDPNYLGEWTKDILYENLTDYANLILLSEGEADPLVVKEALIAGLGVVVSECASANLDRNREFISVVPMDRLSDIDYVKSVIEENRKESLARRQEIREYALADFSWASVLEKYVKMSNG